MLQRRVPINAVTARIRTGRRIPRAVPDTMHMVGTLADKRASFGLVQTATVSCRI
jgi:hypothetical protein